MWTEKQTIADQFPAISNDMRKGGPVILSDNNKLYYDDSENHISVLGRTGCGKTSTVVFTHVLNCLNAGESIVCIDPKGDIYSTTAGVAREKGMPVYVLNFAKPFSSPNCWNPLLYPYRMYMSDNYNDKNRTCYVIDDIVKSLFSNTTSSDQYWDNSAQELASGLIYSLFEKGCEEEINLASVRNMLAQAQQRDYSSFLLRNFAEQYLDDDGLAKTNLQSFTSAPHETRASIHSVTSSGLSKFTKSIGLMHILSHDNTDISNLKVEKPFAIYLILPDEFISTIAPVAAIFLNQIIKILGANAREYKGKLPVRVNVIIEELGQIGKSLPELPTLLSVSRSRNIRIMAVLQDEKQLESIFGKSDADTIIGSFGTTFQFTTNRFDSLEEVSRRCGEKTIEVNGSYITKPLITPTDIQKMGVGVCIVSCGAHRFVAHLPFYNEVFKDIVPYQDPRENIAIPPLPVKRFDMKCWVEKARMTSNFRDISEMGRSSPFSSVPGFEAFNLDQLTARIDEKLFDMEKPDIENILATKKHKYTLAIIKIGEDKHTVVEALSEVLSLTQKSVEKRILETLPVEIGMDNKRKAVSLVKIIANLGGEAIVIDNHKE